LNPILLFDRKKILYGLIIGAILLYTIKLFQMQIIEHSLYDEKSSENSIKAIEQIPLRGVFWDRNMNLLVENIPAYTVRITPADYKKKNNKILEAILGLDSGYVDNLLYRNKEYSKFIPLKVKRGVDFTAISWIEENSEQLPGVDYIIELQRGYPAGVMGSHVFGYSKEVNPAQLKAESDYYNPGDLIGCVGIEKKYEKILRGKKGFNYILVDSKRREVGKYKNGTKDVPSIKGQDLVLGIDLGIQKIAEEELKGRSGAIVAIEPETGEILAMTSAPDFDLNQFSYTTPKDYLEELFTDPLKPQFNRATMAAHPPGSTFKLLSAIAGLESGVIDENSTFYCAGGFTFGRFFKCHAHHGSLNVIHAIEQSCNSFFYQLIFKVGLDRLAQYAARFGLGQKTGVDLSEEVKGLIPTSKYYEKIYGPNWPQGILVSLGIGQGEISITPIQLAQYVALIANNGKSFVPHLVKGYLDENKKFIPLKYPEINTGISQRTFDIVKQGMFLVVNGSGTATAIKTPEIQIAGKTGTAQNPHGKDHAWFICFAPFDHPKIAIAVLVENAGFGATWAAPIAKKMILKYFGKDVKDNSNDKGVTNFAD
jgi:penicillin-binding protein 2